MARVYKRIHVEEIDGLSVPVEFRDRFYDKRKHRLRVRDCKCGIRFYDTSPRLTHKECPDCRILSVNSKTGDIGLDVARLVDSRNKICGSCLRHFIDSSISASRIYCQRCLADHSHDVLNSARTSNESSGAYVAPERLSVYESEVIPLVDQGLTDVAIGSQLGLNSNQVRFVRTRLGLPSRTKDDARVLSGFPSVEGLSVDILQGYVNQRKSYGSITTMPSVAWKASANST